MTSTTITSTSTASPPAPPGAGAAAARRQLAAIVAWDLDGCAAPLPTSVPDPGTWGRLLAAATRQRAEGPLAGAIASGALPVTPAQADQAFHVHRAAMSLTLVLERELLRLHPALAAAGVEALVLKGVATADLDDPDPCNRAFGDVDLLIAPDDLPEAVRVLERHAGRRRHLEPRPGFDARFSKGVSFRFAGNCEIDLHRTLAPGPFGLLIDLDELGAGREGLSIGGTDLVALDRPGRFLHACYHGVLGDAYPRLTTLRDLVLTAPDTDVACREVLARATRWQGDAVVAAAVAHARDAFAWSPPEPLASWVAVATPPARQQRWLRAYTGENRLGALQALHGVLAVDGVTDRVAYARALAFPRPSQRRTPTTERARRGARALVRLTRP